jgi:transcriptional regulator with XRE-family HTH domain
MFRLSTDKLLAAAKEKGDETGYAIAKRTGIDQSAISRILRGRFQPDLNSALRMAHAYDTTVEALMERVEAAA